MAGVVALGVVGVGGVGHVGRHAGRARQGPGQGVGVTAPGGVGAAHQAGEEVAVGAGAGDGADLLVVEQAHDGDRGRRRRPRAASASTAAKQLTRLSRRPLTSSSLVRAGQGGGLDVVEHEVPGQEVVGLGARRQRPRTSRHAGLAVGGPQRLQVLLGVEDQALVDLPVQVDGQLRDAGDRPVQRAPARRGPPVARTDTRPARPRSRSSQLFSSGAAVDLDRRAAATRPTRRSGWGFRRRLGLSVWAPTIRSGVSESSPAGQSAATSAPPRRTNQRSGSVAGPVRGLVHLGEAGGRRGAPAAVATAWYGVGEASRWPSRRRRARPVGRSGIDHLRRRPFGPGGQVRALPQPLPGGAGAGRVSRPPAWSGSRS